MSNISLSSLTYISREDLARQVRASHQAQEQATSAASAAGGSSDSPQAGLTASSTATATANEPAGLPPHIAVIDVRDSDHMGGHIRGSTWVPSSELDYKMPEVLRTMREKEVVVFHCALSQQRGPGAALRYLRERERAESASGEGGEDEEGGKKKEQKVVVLSGGFTEWQEKYGRDERLTEGWRRDVWEGGY